MTNKEFTTYSVKFANSDISSVMGRLERAVLGVDRDLVIVASLILAIGLSDHEILKNDERLRATVDSLSDHLCWLVRMPQESNLKDGN